MPVARIGNQTFDGQISYSADKRQAHALHGGPLELHEVTDDSSGYGEISERR